MWWNAHTHLSSQGRPGQKSHKFKAGLDYVAKSHLQKKKIILKPRKSRRMIRKYTTIAKGSVLQAKCL